MGRARFGVIAIWLGLVLPVEVRAQETISVGPAGALSPRVRAEWVIDGATISIEYSRPFVKARTPGQDIDPYEGREWRTGADRATTLEIDSALRIGDLSVAAGTYTLYTIPVGGVWHLVISRKTGQWGIPYPGRQHDLGRVPMRTRTGPHVEQLTFVVDDTTHGGTITILWGRTRASLPFLVVPATECP